MITDLSDRAKNEVDAIKAIFLDDFKFVDEQTAWKKNWKVPMTRFLLCLRPLEGSSGHFKSNKQIYLVLSIQLPVTYPTKKPQVQIHTAVGVPRDQQRILLKMLIDKTEELEGHEMIFELASLVREYLSRGSLVDSNPERSLYDDMVQRQLTTDKEKADIAKQITIKTQLEAKEQENILSSKIEEELTKKKQRAQEERLQRKKLFEPASSKSSSFEPTVIARGSNLSTVLVSNVKPAEPKSDLASRYSYGPAAQTTSRYVSDFHEIEYLGRGSYGEVVKSQNRLDGRFYAIKKLKLHPKDYEYNRRMIREVTTLSRLHHIYVVRYYQAWLESENNTIGNEVSQSESDTHDIDSVTFEDDFLSISHDATHDSQFIQFQYSEPEPSTEKEEDRNITPKAKKNNSSKTWADVAKLLSQTSGTTQPNQSSAAQSGTLYIQMEYCEKNTLKDSIKDVLSVEESWRLFRQILDGLVYIHSQGMMHRDLKPTNIFLDANGDVKIGDFGLATNLEFDYVNRNSVTAESDDDMTTAPEICGKRIKYDQKVDMYSLGIIFFECVHAFSTEMERVKVLRNLRKEDIIFPADFYMKQLESQAFIIKWLLKHNPIDRPSSAELAQSEHLPPRVENETINETLRTISKPDTPFYSRLITTLFSQKVDRSKDFTFDFNSGQQFDEIKSVIFSKVKDIASKVFRRHGAIEHTTSLLLPKSSIQELRPGLVRLLDSDGTLVELPYDLTVPFVRWVARSEIAYLKRWTFDKVYRQNVSGGQPKMVHESDFDIIHSSPCHMAYEAEILKTVIEILEELPSLNSRGYFIRLNHAKIVDEIMIRSKISRDKVVQVCSIIHNSQSRLPWVQIEKQLMLQAKLSAQTVHTLSTYMQITGSVSDCEKQLGLNMLDAVFKDLKALEDLLRSCGVTCPIYFSSVAVFNYHYYHHGTLFQICLEGSRPDIIAAGGRYDRLLAVYRHPSSTNATFGVGINIAIAKLSNSIDSAYHGTNHTGVLVEETRLWVPHACEILVASFGKISLSERLSVCMDLWNANLPVDYVIEDGRYTTEELQMLCKNRHITWLVILKEHPRDKRIGNAAIKLKNIPLHKEIEVRREEFVDSLLGQMKEFGRNQAEKAGISRLNRRDRTISTSIEPAGSHTISHRAFSSEEVGFSPPLSMLSSSSNINEKDFDIVVVSNPKFSSKLKQGKKQFIVEKAIKSLSPFIEQITGGSTLKGKIEVLAVDLRIPVLKKIAGCENIFNDEYFKKDVADGFPFIRDYIFTIRNTIIDMKKNRGSHIKGVFLYSHTEDCWELLQIK